MAFEQSFSREGLTTIEVELRRGDVVVEEASDDQIGVQATLSSGASDGDLKIAVEAGVLRIAQSPGPPQWGGPDFLSDFNFGQIFGQFGRIDLRLRIPPGQGRLAITTGLGGVRVARWDQLQVRTGKGDILLGRGTGRAEVKTGMGAIRVEGFQGALVSHTGMGEVSISSGEGEARLHTGMGNVLVGEGTLDLDAFTGMGELRLARLGGQAKLRTGMGLIEVVEARNLRVDANSGKGDVRLAGYFGPIQAKVGDGQIRCFLGELAAPVELTTGRGSIDVAFSARQAVRVDASTSRGRIDSEVPLVQVGQPGPEGFFNKRVVGTVGSGEIQATLRLRSGFGNVHLRLLDTGETPSAQPAPGTVEAGEAEQKVAVAAGASGRSWTSPDAPASDQPPRQTRLDVLQALGRGEITIDEAERLLATSA